MRKNTVKKILIMIAVVVALFGAGSVMLASVFSYDSDKVSPETVYQTEETDGFED